MCTKFSLVLKYNNDQKSLVYDSFPQGSVILILFLIIFLYIWPNNTDFSSVNSLQLQFLFFASAQISEG